MQIGWIHAARMSVMRSAGSRTSRISSDPKTRKISSETRSRHCVHRTTMRMASSTMEACVNHSRNACSDTGAGASLPHHRTLEHRSAQIVDELSLYDEPPRRVANEGKWVACNQRNRRRVRRSNHPHIIRIDDVRLCDAIVEFAARRDKPNVVMHAHSFERSEQS